MNRETPPGCHHINVTKHWNVINTTHSFISRNCILFWGKLWLIAAQIISCSDQNLDLRGVKSHVPDVFPMLLCRQRAASSLLQFSELSHEHYHPVIYTKIDALQDSISQEKNADCHDDMKQILTYYLVITPDLKQMNTLHTGILYTDLSLSSNSKTNISKMNNQNCYQKLIYMVILKS